MTYQMNLRRYRQTTNVRRLFQNVHIQESALIQPYFVYENLEKSSLFKNDYFAHVLSVRNICKKNISRILPKHIKSKIKTYFI